MLSNVKALVAEYWDARESYTYAVSHGFIEQTTQTAQRMYEAALSLHREHHLFDTWHRMPTLDEL